MINGKLSIDELAEKIVRDDVFCNVSNLVEFAITKSAEGDQNSPIDFEETYQNQPDFENWTKKELKNWLFEHVYSGKINLSSYSLDDLVQECQDNFTPDEPLEFWAISGWLADKLTAENEIVIDGCPHIWGRCTSGQAIKMDFVIEKIATNLYNL